MHVQLRSTRDTMLIYAPALKNMQRALDRWRSTPLRGQGIPRVRVSTTAIPTRGPDGSENGCPCMLDIHNNSSEVFPHYADCFQVNPRRLLTAVAMLNTIEVNQNAFTESSRTVPTF